MSVDLNMYSGVATDEKPYIKVSYAHNGNGPIISHDQVEMLEKMAVGTQSRANDIYLPKTEQTRAIAQQPPAQPHQINTKAFEYGLNLENQTLQAEIAQNIYQKLLNEITQIAYNNTLKKDEKELKINQMVLNLISGITNLCVIDSESLTPVMLAGLPSSLISEFLTHSKSPEFIQSIALELTTKMEYILLYLKRF